MGPVGHLKKRAVLDTKEMSAAAASVVPSRVATTGNTGEPSHEYGRMVSGDVTQDEEPRKVQTETT